MVGQFGEDVAADILVCQRICGRQERLPHETDPLPGGGVRCVTSIGGRVGRLMPSLSTRSRGTMAEHLTRLCRETLIAHGS